NKNPRFTGVFRADDGARTHDLLHGNHARSTEDGLTTAWLSQIHSLALGWIELNQAISGESWGESFGRRPLDFQGSTNCTMSLSARRTPRTQRLGWILKLAARSVGTFASAKASAVRPGTRSPADRFDSRTDASPSNRPRPRSDPPGQGRAGHP